MQMDIATLNSIPSPPRQPAVYTVGEDLDITDMVVTGTYSDSSTKVETITAANISGFNSTTPAVAQVLTVSVGGKTTTYTVTINAAPIVDATLDPISGSFDKRTDRQGDFQTTITWGSATGVTDVKADGISIEAGNYNVSSNELTIKKEYLAAQSTGDLELTIEFNTGDPATLTISITDTTPPSISPASHNYELNSSADIITVITWNSAESVSEVVYSIGTDTTIYTMNADDYTVDGTALTINSSFFSNIEVMAEESLTFTIAFDTGATAEITEKIVDSYDPSIDADLSNLSVNGIPVIGFDPDDTEYDVELPYGANRCTITATASDFQCTGQHNTSPGPARFRCGDSLPRGLERQRKAIRFISP